MSNWTIADRPLDFDDVYGQPTIVKALKKAQKDNSWKKAYLFMAPYGLGKTTIAKIIAMSLACRNVDGLTWKPCLKCPSCRSVIEDEWSRDVVYINGTSFSADDVRKTLDSFKMSAAFRDRNKVLICDETQDLSPEALNALLQVTESPRKGCYFILNAMGKLKGNLAGALESRCEKWKLKVPTAKDVYLYLVEVCKKHQLQKTFSHQAEFDLFMTEGLETIAQNCDYSYRRAIGMLQQCVDAGLFTKDAIKESLDVEAYEDMLVTVTDIANGRITPTVVATITGKEYQNSFGLISKIVGDAAVVKACGTLGYPDEEKWKEKGSRDLANSPHFDEVKDTMRVIASSTSGYLPRGLWEMLMSDLVSKVRPPQGLSSAPRRRPPQEKE